MSSFLKKKLVSLDFFENNDISDFVFCFSLFLSFFFFKIATGYS